MRKADSRRELKKEIVNKVLADSWAQPSGYS